LKIKKVILSISVLLLLWELLGRVNIYPKYIFPPFSYVAESFIDIKYLHSVIENAIITLIRAGLGFIIGTIAGIVLGFVLVGLKLVEYIQPIATILFVTPSVVWVPLLILWVGLDSFKLSLAATFICSFPPILYGILNSSRTIDLDQVEVALTLGADPWIVLRKVIMPMAILKTLPIIKTEAIMVFKTTIVVEMVALSSGLGYLLLMYYVTIDVQHILATIMILSLIMVSIIELIDVLEKKIASKWIGEVYW